MLMVGACSSSPDRQATPESPKAASSDAAPDASAVPGAIVRAAGEWGSTPESVLLDFMQLDPQSPASVIAARVREDVVWFADDARDGRGVGTPGIAAAEERIAARFASLGLVPVPGLTDYFQTFELPFGREIGPATQLTVAGTAHPSGEKFVPLSISGEGAFDGQVAFVGYAVHAPDANYDDFADIDVKGKVALALRYEPHDAEGKSRLGEGSPHASLVAKAEAAANAGAVALLIVNPPEHHEDVDPLQPFTGSRGPRARIPVLHITPEFANELLEDGGAPDLLTLQRSIDSHNIPASRLLENVSASGNVELPRRIVRVRNVMAMLPGAGDLAGEYIVVGAHHDHVGRGEVGSRPQFIGQIHNGADDNASGTSAMLAVAEELSREASVRGPLPRSIIFQGYTAEESGLLGSRHFVESGLIPATSIRAMVNLDMVGRVTNQKLYVGGYGTSRRLEPLSPLDLTPIGAGGRGPSDHQSFSSAGVPVLFFFSGLHPDYHAPGDDAEKVNVDGIASVVGLAFDVVRTLAHETDALAYVGDFDARGNNVNVTSGTEPSSAPVARRSSRRPQLGIEPEYLTDDTTPGILLAGVVPGTSAEVAGLKKGDRIIKLDGTETPNLEAMMPWLQQATVGSEITITFIRDGQTQTAKTTLKPRAEGQ
jgi:hypothetical protein